MARFWESWVSRRGLIGAMVPFVTIAVASGLFVGFVVGALIRDHSIRVAAWAGVLACAMWLAAALAVGGLEWAAHNYSLLGAPCIAIGLLVGALLGRQIRHA
jgi:hypothetical protein